MNKSIFLILCLVLINSVAFAEGGLVAIVNNEAITQKDLNDFLNFMRMQMSTQYSEQVVEQKIKDMQPDLINRLIEDRLILQAAYKENITVEQIRIKARIEQIKKNYPTEADFQNALAAQGLTLADIEAKIQEQLLMFAVIDEKVKKNIVIRPQEVTDYYSAHIQDFNKPQRRLVRFLRTEDSDLIQQLQKAITEYGDLDAIARQYSLDITDLGWVTSKQLKEEIADIVFNLEVGSLSSNLNSNGEFYILEVKAIKFSEKSPLLEVQEEINRYLFEIKMHEAMFEWLEKLKSEAYIEIKQEYEAG